MTVVGGSRLLRWIPAVVGGSRLSIDLSLHHHDVRLDSSGFLPVNTGES